MNAHEIVQQHFLPAGLVITNREWNIREDGSFSFKGSLKFYTEGSLTQITGATHQQIEARANSPLGIITKLFTLAKSNKMFLGDYGSYHSIIEWSEENKKFITRTLTEAEKSEHSTVL